MMLNHRGLTKRERQCDSQENEYDANDGGEVLHQKLFPQWIGDDIKSKIVLPNIVGQPHRALPGAHILRGYRYDRIRVMNVQTRVTVGISCLAHLLAVTSPRDRCSSEKVA